MTGLVSSFTWRFEEVKREEMNEEEDDGETEVVWEEEDRVRPIHPVFTIGHEHARAMRAYFEKKPLSV
ncbi:hypothetical protein KEM55_003660 [Ascosphaera atra]|nr:hypothetical protein KEM55_003660 [Ascosphaera atra]